MRQFSIRTLMVVVVAAALGVMVLKNVRYWWSGLLPLMAGFALEVAVLSALLLRSRHRSWWMGFGLSFAGYLALALHPTSSSDLGTARFLEYAHATLAERWLDVFGNWIAIEPYMRVGHGLFAVLFGLTGGTIVVWLHSRQNPARNGDVATPNQTAT